MKLPRRPKVVEDVLTLFMCIVIKNNSLVAPLRRIFIEPKQIWIPPGVKQYWSRFNDGAVLRAVFVEVHKCINF